MEKTYRDEIISKNRPISDVNSENTERAAQFLSFEELSGFDEKINELKKSQTEKSTDNTLNHD